MKPPRKKNISRLATPHSAAGAPVAGLGGFTLLEMIAVLAVIALLVAALAPALIRRISEANLAREASDLATMADAFKQQVLRQKIIPGSAGWVSLVQTELSLAPNDIGTNSLGYARAFLIDPALSIGTNTAATLPFNQSSNGVASVNNARFLIVSSLYKSLPVSSGIPTSAVFSNLWHMVDGGVPSGWPSEWSGKGDQLKIRRIELNSAFRRIILNPLDPKQYGRTTVDNSQPVAVTSIRSAWFLEGTLIGLYNTNNPAGTNFLEGREFLHSDRSYVFENGRWRAQIFDGKEPAASDPFASVFNDTMSPFVNGPSSSTANGTSPKLLVSMFYAMMLDYYHWSVSPPGPFNPGSFYYDMLHRDYDGIHAVSGELAP